MENLIKTSFSWQELCFHAPVYVFRVPSSWIVILFPKKLNVEEEQDLGQNASSVNIFVFPARKQEKIS